MKNYNIVTPEQIVILLLLFGSLVVVVSYGFDSGNLHAYGYDFNSSLFTNNRSNIFDNNTFIFLKSGFNDSQNYLTSMTNTSNSMQLIFDKQTDDFGIQKLYSTTENGEEWYMNMSDPLQDKQFDPKDELIRNQGDNSWHVDDSKVRMNVYTSSGYNESKIMTYDQKELAKKGYMQSPNDWKNVEMTGFVKYDEGNYDQNFAWYVRGGK